MAGFQVSAYGRFWVSTEGEGIDLHRWCRRVVLYDLEWNPALLEQQIGRVDRIGSLSRRDQKPLEVVWTVTPGTYEAHIKQTVEKRLELMRVLLGAGGWLAASPETQEQFEALDPYLLDFRPEGYPQGPGR